MGMRGEKNIRDTLEAYKIRFNFLNKHYTENKEKTINWYLKMMRRLICYSPSQLKKALKEVWGEYKLIYKLTSKHDKKEVLFRRFNWIYKTLYKIRAKI